MLTRAGRETKNNELVRRVSARYQICSYVTNEGGACPQRIRAVPYFSGPALIFCLYAILVPIIIHDGNAQIMSRNTEQTRVIHVFVAWSRVYVNVNGFPQEQYPDSPTGFVVVHSESFVHKFALRNQQQSTKLLVESIEFAQFRSRCVRQ